MAARFLPNQRAAPTRQVRDPLWAGDVTFPIWNESLKKNHVVSLGYC
jgi:hypothetical protein